MIRVKAVEVDEVLPVVGDHGALVCSCVAEHLLIGDGIVGLACVA